ncbi:MAG: hypothetical protein HQL56_09975 [Magnetococcales bacterium]|nr:hypothetical protein [Magnetococcales bacterium]
MFAPSTYVGGSQVSHGSDENLFVEFFYKAIPDRFRSEQEGRPIHTQKVYVRILTPGQKDEFVGPARDKDRERFPRQWDAFQRNMTLPLDGTPLEQWPALEVSQVADLKSLNIFTVDQLASLSDNALQKVGLGARELVARAQAYLEQARGNAPAERLAASLQRSEEEIERLKEEVARLAGLLEQEASNDEGIPVAAPRRGRRVRVANS